MSLISDWFTEKNSEIGLKPHTSPHAFLHSTLYRNITDLYNSTSPNNEIDPELIMKLKADSTVTMATTLLSEARNMYVKH